jgi:hypothetical protein
VGFYIQIRLQNMVRGYILGNMPEKANFKSGFFLELGRLIFYKPRSLRAAGVLAPFLKPC